MILKGNTWYLSMIIDSPGLKWICIIASTKSLRNRHCWNDLPRI